MNYLGNVEKLLIFDMLYSNRYPLYITWRKDGNTTTIDGRRLKLTDVRKHNEGVYRCNAPSAEMIYHVKIIGKNIFTLFRLCAVFLSSKRKKRIQLFEVTA